MTFLESGGTIGKNDRRGEVAIPETCNDFNALLAAVVVEAQMLGIPVAPGLCTQVDINHRATTRFGCCIKQGKGYRIQLSARLLTVQEHICRQTLAHEVLHTCPDCRNHGPRWKEYAQRMNQAYGYQIARTHSCQSMGVPDNKPVRHLVVCEGCGMEFKRARSSPLTQHPERYRCRCGGKLRVEF